MKNDKTADRQRWMLKHPQKYREVQAHASIKLRCAKKNLEFGLTKKWIHEKYSGVCEVTGTPFSYEINLGNHSPFAPSVDRIDCNKGYTQDNCQVVVWIYNRAKGSNCYEDVMRMARYLSYKEATYEQPPIFKS